MLAFFKNITAQIPDSFIQSNFGLVEYIDGKCQLRPMYEWQKNTLNTEEYLRALNEIKGIKFNNTLINVNSLYTAAVLAAFFMHERFSNE